MEVHWRCCWKGCNTIDSQMYTAYTLEIIDAGGEDLLDYLVLQQNASQIEYFSAVFRDLCNLFLH